MPGFDLAGLGQVRLFESVMAALGAVGQDRPVLLVIEDIHWADRSTLDLLQFLVRNIADTPTLILATVRTDELDRDDPVATMLAELARRPSVERIDLGPLDLAATSAQLAVVLGVEPDPALARRIHRRSDGNPFFIEQLAWAHADGESTSVPASLRDILLTQLSRQAPEVQDLLAAAAIAGPGVDDTLLASIVGCSTDALLDPLRAAIRAQLLSRIPTGTGEAYAFRHALMAEATEADLIDGERRRLHGRCADALAARRPEEGAALAQWAVRIAHHRDRSGDIDAAVSASIEAAIQAAAVTAHADAMEQYRHAIGLLPQWRGPQLWSDWDVAELYGHAAACAALIGDATSSARYSRDAIASLPPDDRSVAARPVPHPACRAPLDRRRGRLRRGARRRGRRDPGRAADRRPRRRPGVARLPPHVCRGHEGGRDRPRGGHRDGRRRRRAPGGGPRAEHARDDPGRVG